VALSLARIYYARAMKMLPSRRQRGGHMSSGTDRLDAVNIRIGIAAADTQRTAAALRLHDMSASGTTVHLLSHGPTNLGLSAAGISLLFEQDMETTWVTVRIRPMRRALLDAKWTGFRTDGQETLHIEQERDANSRVLIARLVAAGPSRGSPIAETGVTLADVLRPRQRSFIEHCAGIQVGAQPVHLSRPVRTHRWAVRLDRVDAHIQRWVVSPAVGEQGGFDALEVSRRLSELEADFLLPALSAALRRRGLEPQDTIGRLEERAGFYLSDGGNSDSM
jgi:hypothetical protein